MKYENENMISVHYESMSDFPFDFKVTNGCYRSRILLDEVHNKIRPTSKWFGTAGITGLDVIKRAITGDNRLLDVVNKQASRITSQKLAQGTPYQVIKKVKRRKTRKAFGDEIDMQRIYQGQSDKAWGTTELVAQDTKHKFVTLVATINALANYDAVDTLNTAVALLKLSDELQKAGKQTKIIIAFRSTSVFRHNHKVNTGSIVIKNYNDYLAPNRLVAMAHTGFFRAAGFLMKAHTELKLRQSLGYSQVISEVSHLPIPLRQEYELGHTKFVYLNRADSLQDAQREIDNAYRQLEILGREQV